MHTGSPFFSTLNIVSIPIKTYNIQPTYKNQFPSGFSTSVKGLSFHLNVSTLSGLAGLKG